MIEFVREHGAGRYRIECRGSNGRVIKGGAVVLERRDDVLYPRVADARTSRNYKRTPTAERLEARDVRRARRGAQAARRTPRATLRESEAIAREVVGLDRIASDLSDSLAEVKRQQARIRKERERMIEASTAFEARVVQECDAFGGQILERMAALTEMVTGLANELKQARGRQRASRQRLDGYDAELVELRTEVAALRERLEQEARPSAGPSLATTNRSPRETATPHSPVREQSAQDRPVGPPTASEEKNVGADMEKTQRLPAIVQVAATPTPMERMESFLRGRTPAGASNGFLGARKGRY